MEKNKLSNELIQKGPFGLHEFIERKEDNLKGRRQRIKREQLDLLTIKDKFLEIEQRKSRLNQTQLQIQHHNFDQIREEANQNALVTLREQRSFNKNLSVNLYQKMVESGIERQKEELIQLQRQIFERKSNKLDKLLLRKQELLSQLRAVQSQINECNRESQGQWRIPAQRQNKYKSLKKLMGGEKIDKILSCRT